MSGEAMAAAIEVNAVADTPVATLPVEAVIAVIVPNGIMAYGARAATAMTMEEAA